jgi:3D (Asp-Asp-Asp) domain-containing protein/uncharacterized protein YabE (DUF348 family)
MEVNRDLTKPASRFEIRCLNALRPPVGGMAQFQKGPALIAKDQIATLVAASTFTLGLAFACSGAAGAVEPAGTESASAVGSANAAPAEPTVLTLSENGTDVQVSTRAETVGALLQERGESAVPGDAVVPALTEPLVWGMRVMYRRAVPVEIHVGRTTDSLRSAAPTVRDLLAEQHVDVAARDEVSPALSQPVSAGTVVRVVRVSRWLAHVHRPIAPALKTRRDARLALGTSRVIARGIPGMRETTVRFEKRDDGPAVSTIIASRIVRAPSAKIVVRGARRYPSLAGVARQGFASALHFAGSALHMLASAYTAGCYGCTGMTASGLHAGFGVIAVDPSIIPLGTKLFIPGYGRAVAGDTGGAIHGHRIDLGFNTNGEAFEWGSRAVTVYLLR